jgi:hypothetical protein
MDDDTLLFLLRGGHIPMDERVERGLWPHPPIKFAQVVNCLAAAIASGTWFPYEWKPVPGEAIREGGIIEKQSRWKYVYHAYRHQALNPYILAGRAEKTFWSSRAAARYYLKWDLHLPGDLDGWKVGK